MLPIGTKVRVTSLNNSEGEIVGHAGSSYGVGDVEKGRDYSYRVKIGDKIYVCMEHEVVVGR